jgi:hypothetical protein
MELAPMSVLTRTALRELTQHVFQLLNADPTGDSSQANEYLNETQWNTHELGDENGFVNAVDLELAMLCVLCSRIPSLDTRFNVLENETARHSFLKICGRTPGAFNVIGLFKQEENGLGPLFKGMMMYVREHRLEIEILTYLPPLFFDDEQRYLSLAWALHTARESMCGDPINILAWKMIKRHPVCAPRMDDPNVLASASGIAIHAAVACMCKYPSWSSETRPWFFRSLAKLQGFVCPADCLNELRNKFFMDREMSALIEQLGIKDRCIEDTPAKEEPCTLPAPKSTLFKNLTFEFGKFDKDPYTSFVSDLKKYLENGEAPGWMVSKFKEEKQKEEYEALLKQARDKYWNV